MGFDIIGDVHGHAHRLEALLVKLGYRNRSGAWRHPERTAVFVGDLVDRGPHQLNTLRIVRSMMECGAAQAVMGNHEFNAIGFLTGHRPRSEKNRKQAEAFLREIDEDSEHHKEWVDWFKRLPFWIDEPEFRVVHACWSPPHVDALRLKLGDGKYLTDEVLYLGSTGGNAIHRAVETVLKGIEVNLPKAVSFHDKEGHKRHEMRTRWWDRTALTFRAAYMGPPAHDIPDTPIPDYEPPPEVDRPTFIGHYWFPPEEAPAPVAPMVACLDYSAAKGGPLVAYRFDNEPVLTAKNFVSV